MQQNKFKFGERVKNGDRVFTVNAVFLQSGYYYYVSTDTSDMGCIEHKLELYQEPKEKKLSAYMTLQGREIKFYASDFDEKESKLRGLIRVPDLDIEYPDKET